MDKITRWNRLVEMLTAAEGGRLSIEQVVRELNVSAATVRRDFDELADQQLLVRTRGGALANGVSFDLPLRYKAGRHQSEKHWIAAAAADLVGPVKVVVLGGVARPQSYELTGPLAATLLREISLDVAILGVDAIDAGTGASAHHEGEASINQAMGGRADQVVIVADGSKVGRVAFARILPIDRVDILVTDPSAPTEAVRAIEAAGCKVVLANSD